jgi:hypothetical protein
MEQARISITGVDPLRVRAALTAAGIIKYGFDVQVVAVDPEQDQISLGYASQEDMTAFQQANPETYAKQTPTRAWNILKRCGILGSNENGPAYAYGKVDLDALTNMIETNDSPIFNSGIGAGQGIRDFVCNFLAERRLQVEAAASDS